MSPPSSPATRRPRQWLAALTLPGAGALLVAVTMPASLYLGNRLEFAASLPALLAQFLPAAALLVVLAASIGAVLPQATFERLRALAATLVILLWVQGNLLVWNYGVLDGRPIDFARDSWRGWLDLGLWTAALLLADAYRVRAGKLLVRAAIALVALQTVAVALSLPGARGEREAGEAAPDDSVAAVAAFSSRGNVIHIVADGFQSDVFEDLLAADGGQGPIGRGLDGFVFAQDHLGAYLYTHMSVPALLSGRLYLNQEPREVFLARALGEQSVLAAAATAGYRVEVAAPVGALTQLYRRIGAAHIAAIELAGDAGVRDAERAEALVLADLTLFRLVPHFAKQLVYGNQAWLLQSLFGDARPEGRSFFAHNAWLRSLAAAARADAGPPRYKLLHLMLSHNPMVAASDCSYAGHVLPGTRRNVQVQAGCSLASMLELLDRLRAVGVYDVSTIVISGDHGSWLAPARLKRDPEAQRQLLDEGFSANYVGQAMPLLLIKPPVSRGPLQVVEAPTWIVDTAATIAAAAGIPGEFPGVSVLGAAVEPSRPRAFYAYDYAGGEWLANYLTEIREYTVTGKVQDAASWRRGPVHRAPDTPTTVAREAAP